MWAGGRKLVGMGWVAHELGAAIKSDGLPRYPRQCAKGLAHAANHAG